MRKSASRNKRSAFTLVDLCVITAVGTVMAGLLLPAILHAREEARQTTCANNLKKIGLGLHNYHDTYGVFPAAWYARHTEPESPSWIGWQTSLLPYVEQVQLWTTIRAFPEWPDDPKFTQTYIADYICPNDTMGSVNPARGGFGTSNYSGNFGPDVLPRWYESGQEKFWPGGLPATSDSHGMFYVNRCVGLRQITDGTSYTVMVGERSVRSAAGLWTGVRSNRDDNDAITDMSFLSPLNKSLSGFSSQHGAVVNMLFCDGAVRPIRDDIESREDGTGIMQRLSDRADGQPISAF